MRSYEKKIDQHLSKMDAHVLKMDSHVLKMDQHLRELETRMTKLDKVLTQSYEDQKIEAFMQKERTAQLKVQTLRPQAT